MTRGPSAITLVEFVVTLVLIAVLAFPIGIFVQEVLRLVMSSRDSAAALNLARHEMERLDAIDDFFAPDLALGTTTLTDYQGTRYTLYRIVTCELIPPDPAADHCVDPDLTVRAVKRVRVEVARPDVGAFQSGSMIVGFGKVPIVEPLEPLIVLETFRTKGVRYGS